MKTKLWIGPSMVVRKKISTEQDYLQAKQALAEARINKHSAEQKLHALGFPVERLETSARHSLTRYEIVAPFAGTIIEKHITLGEALEENATTFVVADLSTVWVDLTVYPKDLPLVELGRVAVISATQSDQGGRHDPLHPTARERGDPDQPCASGP